MVATLFACAGSACWPRRSPLAARRCCACCCWLSKAHAGLVTSAATLLAPTAALSLGALQAHRGHLGRTAVCRCMARLSAACESQTSPSTAACNGVERRHNLSAGSTAVAASASKDARLPALRPPAATSTAGLKLDSTPRWPPPSDADRRRAQKDDHETVALTSRTHRRRWRWRRASASPNGS